MLNVKCYLFLIIVMCVVQQRICKPLDMIHNNEYNGFNEITTKAIDLNVPSGYTEPVHLIRRARSVLKVSSNCKRRFLGRRCKPTTTTANPLE
ncbi:hypothetical protein DOY81_008621 [Sarcophaga bullata]|nr:hypothetical protein DOY81_008621 [Sarcophaga bullata]